MVCGPVIQCNFSCNYSRNSLKSDVTSALLESLRRVAYHETDKVLVRHFATAVEESWNLVLLSAAVEATCFRRALTVRGVLHGVIFHLTCHAVFEKIAGHVA